MAAFKKRLLVVSALLFGSLGLITIGFDEVERKEAVARDPQGNIVPPSAPGEAVGTGARRLAPKTFGPKTFGESIKDVDLSKASPFVAGIAARTTRRTKRLEQLPRDMHEKINSFLGDEYVLWRSLNLSQDGATQVAFRDNGANLVSTASVGKSFVYVYTTNMTTGKTLKRLDIPVGRSDNYLLSENGQAIAVWSRGNKNSIDVWNTKTGRKTASIELVIEGGPISLVAFSANGRVLAVENRNESKCILVDVDQYNKVFASYNIALGERKYALSDDVFCIIKSGKLFLWDISNDQAKAADLGLDQGSIIDVGFSNNGKIFAVTSEDTLYGQDRLILFDYNPITKIFTRRASIDTSLYFEFGVLSNNGKIIAGAFEKHCRRFWLMSTLTGETIQAINSLDSTVYMPVRFSPDDNVLAIARANGIQLWRRSTALLQDVFKKQQQVEEYRSRNSRSSSGSSSSSSSSSLPASGSGGASSVLPSQIDKEWAVEPIDDAVTMHVSHAGEQGEK